MNETSGKNVEGIRSTSLFSFDPLVLPLTPHKNRVSKKTHNFLIHTKNTGTRTVFFSCRLGVFGVRLHAKNTHLPRFIEILQFI